MPEQIDTTRKKLVEAAIKVFAAKGQAQATVREICAQAGANVAAVNYHFGGKDALYGEVLQRVFSDASMDVERLTDHSLPPEQRLEEYIRSFCLACYACKDCDPEAGAAMGAVYLMEMANPSPALDRVVEDYIRHEADALGDIVSGLLGPEAGEDLIIACGQLVVAQVLSGVTLRPIISRLNRNIPPMEDRLEQSVKLITRFSLGGIRAIRETFLQTPQTEVDNA